MWPLAGPASSQGALQPVDGATLVPQAPNEALLRHAWPLAAHAHSSGSQQPDGRLQAGLRMVPAAADSGVAGVLQVWPPALPQPWGPALPGASLQPWLRIGRPAAAKQPKGSNVTSALVLARQPWGQAAAPGPPALVGGARRPASADITGPAPGQAGLPAPPAQRPAQATPPLRRNTGAASERRRAAVAALARARSTSNAASAAAPDEARGEAGRNAGSEAATRVSRRPGDPFTAGLRDQGRAPQRSSRVAAGRKPRQRLVGNPHPIPDPSPARSSGLRKAAAPPPAGAARGHSQIRLTAPPAAAGYAARFQLSKRDHAQAPRAESNTGAEEAASAASVGGDAEQLEGWSVSLSPGPKAPELLSGREQPKVHAPSIGIGSDLSRKLPQAGTQPGVLPGQLPSGSPSQNTPGSPRSSTSQPFGQGQEAQAGHVLGQRTARSGRHTVPRGGAPARGALRRWLRAPVLRRATNRRIVRLALEQARAPAALHVPPLFIKPKNVHKFLV